MTNSSKSKTALRLLTLSALAALGVTALAAGTTSTSATTAQTRAAPSVQGQAQNAQPRALQVRYYAADPLSGGKLLATKTLQLPGARGAGAGGTNPLTAQAPTGAKFAAIADGHGGARVIDLSQPDVGPGMRGGPGGHHGGPGGLNGGPGSGNSQPGIRSAPDGTNT